MSKIVFVCQAFHPDQQATSQLLANLLEALAKRGHHYEVLAGFPADNALARDCPRNEIWNGMKIRRGGLRLNYRRSLVARALGYIFYCLWVMWRLVFHSPRQAKIIVVTNPPFAPVLVYWCSWLRKCTYDLMLQDVYPDGLVAVQQWTEESMGTRVWRKLNTRAFAAARQVLVLGRDMASLCEDRYGLTPEKIRYTPNWSLVSSMRSVAAENTRLWRQLGLRREFVVQYSGNMGLWHDLECIIRAAAILRNESDIRFLLIGAGLRRARAEQLSRELGLKNVIWLPFQPKEQLDDSLACCHVALISQRAGLTGVAVPCKLYGILASGRAVLAQVPADSEVAMVVKEEICGVVTTPGDANELAENIRLLARDRDRVAELGRRAFNAYKTKYTIAIAADTFEAIWHAKVGASLAQ